MLISPTMFEENWEVLVRNVVDVCTYHVLEFIELYGWMFFDECFPKLASLLYSDFTVEC